MVLPDQDDIVVRQKHGNPFTVYLLGTFREDDEEPARSPDAMSENT